MKHCIIQRINQTNNEDTKNAVPAVSSSSEESKVVDHPLFATELADGNGFGAASAWARHDEHGQRAALHATRVEPS